MSILQTVLVFLGIPLVIYGLIAALSLLGKPLPGEKPRHYDLSQQWTADPVLWSATDEMIEPGHSYDMGELPHADHAAFDKPESPSQAETLIGGRASGKF